MSGNFCYSDLLSNTVHADYSAITCNFSSTEMLREDNTQMSGRYIWKYGVLLLACWFVATGESIKHTCSAWLVTQ